MPSWPLTRSFSVRLKCLIASFAPIKIHGMPWPCSWPNESVSNDQPFASISQRIEQLRAMLRQLPTPAAFGNQMPRGIFALLFLIHRQNLEFGFALDFCRRPRNQLERNPIEIERQLI